MQTAIRVLGCLVFLAQAALPEQTLKVSPATVMWGYFSADTKPAATVKPGETITIDTICGDPDQLVRAKVREDDSLREMKTMHAQVKDHGPGPHFMTGPVYIEGAMPGDTLEVEIVDIRLRSDYGWMWMGPESGALAGDYPYMREKLVPFDREKLIGEFGPRHPRPAASLLRQPRRRAARRPPRFFEARLSRRQPGQQVAGGRHEALHPRAGARRAVRRR